MWTVRDYLVLHRSKKKMAKRLAVKSICHTMGQPKKGKSPSVAASQIGVTPRCVGMLWAEFCATMSPNVSKTLGRPATCCF